MEWRYRWIKSGVFGDLFFDNNSNSNEIVSLIEWGKKVYELFPSLFQDIYLLFFLPEPSFRCPENMPTAGIVNYELLNYLIQDPVFKKNKYYTTGNEKISLKAALLAAEQFLSLTDAELFSVVNKVYHLEDKLYHISIRKKALKKIYDAALAAGLEETTLYIDRFLEGLQREALSCEKQLKKATDHLEDYVNRSKQGAVAGIISDRLDKKIKMVNSSITAWGNGTGTWEKTRLGHKIDFMEKCLKSPKLERIANRLIQLKEIGDKIENTMDQKETSNIICGGDLEAVVPDEAVNFINPLRKKYFYQKFIEETLTVYNDNVIKNKKGLLIICIDNSGSMQGAQEELSKAIALALAQLMLRKGRDIIFIMFGGPGDELKIFKFYSQNYSIEDLLAAGEYFLCSRGTDYEKPLRKAVDIMEENCCSGDIVFITDGVCSPDPFFMKEFQKTKKQKKFSVIGIMVKYGDIPTVSMEAFCDEIIKTRDLKGYDAAEKLISLFLEGKE